MKESLLQRWENFFFRNERQPSVSSQTLFSSGVVPFSLSHDAYDLSFIHFTLLNLPDSRKETGLFTQIYVIHKWDDTSFQARWHPWTRWVCPCVFLWGSGEQRKETESMEPCIGPLDTPRTPQTLSLRLSTLISVFSTGMYIKLSFDSIFLQDLITH